MNILITGGCGFIGCHLTDRLIAQGHTVAILDRFTHGKKEFKCANNAKNLHLHRIDVTDPKQIKQSYFSGIDWVFHLVATKIPNPNPYEHHNVNVNSTVYILEAARKAKVKKFIFTGAAACYGMPLKNPVYENSPIQPANAYSLTKYLAEQYILHWGKIYQLPVIILRLFNLYGPKVREHGGYGPTLSIFLDQKSKGLPMTIRGDGNQTRDFTYVSDITNALIKAAKSDVANEIINIGSGIPTSVNTLVELLGGKKIYLPIIANDARDLYPDISKAKRLLGWHPQVLLKEGIENILKDFHASRN